jgi:hypothetical protein
MTRAPDILSGPGPAPDAESDDSFEGLSPEARALLGRQQQSLHVNAALGAQACARPLPGALAGAFAPPVVEIAGLRVRSPRHYDFVALQVLESPLLKEFEAAAKASRLKALGKKVKRRPPTPWTDEQGYEIIYQFTRPAEELLSLVQAPDRKKAVAEYRQRALREIGLQLGPVEVALLVASVSREFEAYFSTWLRYESKGSGSGGETVFTTPPPGTAPVGGSTTTAASGGISR